MMAAGGGLAAWTCNRYFTQSLPDWEEVAIKVKLTAPWNLSTCKVVKASSVRRRRITGFSRRLNHLTGVKSPKPEQKSRHLKLEGVDEDDTCMDFASLIQALSKAKRPNTAENLFLKMKSDGILPDSSTLSAMMLCYANNGFLIQARSIWDEYLNSSFLPKIQVISELIDALGKTGHFNEVIRIVHELSSRDLNSLPQVYKLAISCFGKNGQIEMMENMMKEMVSRGFLVDSVTANAFVIYHSHFGSLTEMEVAYGRVRRSNILIEEEAIRAMSFSYIKRKQFYRLGEFLRELGLGRKNAGNLLWNLLLLSYAANFKMKSLQKEFLNMVDAGFNPDITTFNIRALAFSKMCLFWDLHLSLEHMNHNKVIPDLVTYGCVVDAYMDRRLAQNLDFALRKMMVDDFPMVPTDPFVFEVFGKGEFHQSSEAFLEFKGGRPWTYKELIAIYLRKHSRKSQIFWNY